MRWEVWVVLVLLGCLGVQGSSFDPSRCKLVDQTVEGALRSNVTNYLVRGSFPSDQNGEFAWNQINETLHQLIPGLAEYYVMLDLSLLSDTEPLEEQMEKSFFRGNPQLGSYQRWPIWGNIIIV